MTPEQKADNKARQKVRDKAYRERRKVFQQAADEAVELAVQTYLPPAETADKALNDLLEQRNQEIDVLQRQIDALQAQVLQVEKRYEPSIDEARILRRDAYTLLSNERRKAEQAVEAQYPDMQEEARWSAPAWSNTEIGQRMVADALKAANFN